MSEYQYYEFRAIDKPLDRKATEALRKITSRAEITPTSLTNEYHWGDFKGDPAKLMEQYFDAHLYYANWGTHQFMLRVPAKLLPLAAVEPYTTEETVGAWKTKEHVILDFSTHIEDNWDEWQEGSGEWMESFISLRSDLMAGDLRALYIGWLAAVESGEVSEDEVEPPVPPGLGKISASLAEFAEFLYVDPDLLEVAASASGKSVPTGPSTAELAAWVAKLPEKEKNSALVQLLEGEGGAVSAELLGRFRSESRKKGGAESATAGQRTVKELLAARDGVAEENRRIEAQKKAKEAARKAREREEARARHLELLVGREDDLWDQVEAAIRTKLPKQYDAAIELLRDLRDLAERSGTGTAFASRVQELRNTHQKKPSFLARLDKANLPN
ncbi:MAG: hypothetical protein L0241_08250 [Planctomycetia bacterium]|nr:hypothetical protein [Planctomycetia bacterium]